MSDNNEQNWDNYWQGRSSGEALVRVGIEHNAKLADFWAECFKPFGGDTKLLDMACGAGSVLRHADKAGIKNLTGVDISTDAIQTMCSALPKARGVVSPVDKTGLNAQAYDIVVSQFGFEYAGMDKKVLASAAEMARLIAKNGRFIALCHIKGGSIESEVKGHLKDIAAIENTRFIAASKAVFTAAFAAEKAPSNDSKAAYQTAVEGLGGPRDKIVAWINQNQAADGQIAGLAAHLYNGTIKMFARRKAHSLEDITGWLGGMDDEIQAYKGRMASMKQAALSQKNTENILDAFSQSGFTAAPPEKLYLNTGEKPTAWILKASRN